MSEVKYSEVFGNYILHPTIQGKQNEEAEMMAKIKKQIEDASMEVIYKWKMQQINKNGEAK